MTVGAVLGAAPLRNRLVWHLGILVILGAAITWVYWSLIAGDRVLPWDATTEFFPDAFFASAALHAGHFPWWNPFIYAGVPQAADPQALTFSPLLAAWMLVNTPTAGWFACGVLLHLLLGGWAFAVFQRTLGNTFVACAIGALVFVFGGVATARIEHVPIIIAYCWLAVAFAAYAGWRSRATTRRALLFGVALGLLGVHLVQVTYLGASLLAAFMLIDGFMRRDERPPLRQCMTCVLVPAFIICLPQAASTLAYIGISNRDSLSLADSAGASLTWSTLATVILPNYFHALAGAYDGPADITEAWLYIGMLPLAALFALPCALRDAAGCRTTLFFAIAMIASLLYMLGTHTPVYGFMYEWAPGMNLFRRPSDAAFIFNFALAAMVAASITSWPRLSRRLRALLPIAAGLWLAASLALLDREIWQAWTGLALGLFAGTCLYLNRLRAIAALSMLALVGLDYSSTLAEGRLFAGDDLAPPMRASATRAFLRDAARANPGAWRIEAADTSLWWDNFVMLDGIRTTQGYNPIRYQLYDRVYGARASGNAPRPSRKGNAVGGALFNLLSVRYFVTTQRSIQMPPSGFRRMVEDEQFIVWQNPHAYPRLLTPRRVDVLPPGAEPPVQAFESNDFNDAGWITPRDTRDADSIATRSAACTGTLTIVGTRFRLDALTVLLDSEHGGWLIDNDLDFPGWTAKLDGIEVPVHRANRMFRAVCIPAGRHKLKLAFRPLRMVREAVLHASSYR